MRPQIERRLTEEAGRAQTYLSPSTEPLLITLLEKTLITAHLNSVLSHTASGLPTLIQDSRIPDLQRIYRLFGRVDTGHTCLKIDIAKWIIDIGKQVNDGLAFVLNEDEPEQIVEGKGKGRAMEEGDAPPPKKKVGSEVAGEKTRAALAWVQSVLDLKDKFDRMLAEAFNSDKEFEKSINEVRFSCRAVLQLADVLCAGIHRIRQREFEGARVHFALYRRESQKGSERSQSSRQCMVDRVLTRCATENRSRSRYRPQQNDRALQIFDGEGRF